MLVRAAAPASDRSRRRLSGAAPRLFGQPHRLRSSMSGLDAAGRPGVGRDDLDGADYAGVELGEILGRDPVLQDGLPADLVEFVPVEERLADFEPRDVAGA